MNSKSRAKEADRFEREHKLGKYADPLAGAPTGAASGSGGSSSSAAPPPAAPAAAGPKGPVAEPHRHIVILGAGADALAHPKFRNKASVHVESFQKSRTARRRLQKAAAHTGALVYLHPTEKDTSKLKAFLKLAKPTIEMAQAWGGTVALDMPAGSLG